jgi:uncharacterized protein YqiB (DUF1249 family)
MNYINVEMTSHKNMMQKKRYVPDLSHLMAVCELNYARLQKLFPHMRNTDHHQLNVTQNRQDFGAIHFTVQERAPFTTHLSITRPQHQWSAHWQMVVRIYHDAKLAEVIECQAQPRIRAVNDYPNTHMHQPDEKMQLNIFLGEWLQHCLNYGHSAEKIVAIHQAR